MHIRATDLARLLGIPIRTVVGWCHRDPALGFKKGHLNYIRVEKLAEKPGMDLVKAYLLPQNEQKWLTLAQLSKMTGIPRRTLAGWAKTRPTFARRLGRNWYVCLETLTDDPEQLEYLGHLSKNEEEDP